MRIVYIHQYYATRDMPGGTRSFEMARRLVRDGHEVHILTTDRYAAKPGLTWRQTTDDGITVHWHPSPYSPWMSYRRRVGAFLQFAIGATAKAASLAPDLVFATSTPLTVAIPGVLASKMRRAPFVFEVRDLWPEVPIELGALRHPVLKAAATWLARWAYRNADKVIALSPGMADGVVAQGYPRDAVVVVPNGCDVDLFSVTDEQVQQFRQSRDWLGQRPLVVYTGTLGRVNGVDYLVRVAGEVAARDADVRFLIIGDGQEQDTVRHTAEELGVLEKSVFIEPRLPKTDIPVVFGAATIATSLFIPVPGLRNNSANKFFDSLAAACPVAVNYGGWQAELLTEHGAGLTLPANDPSAAAELLMRHVHDTEWRKSAAEAARRLAGHDFSREHLFNRFENALVEASLAGKKRNRRRASAPAE